MSIDTLPTNLPQRSFDTMDRIGEPYEGVPYFPHWAYREYLDTLRNVDNKPSLYVSMAITSGGFRRDQSLEMSEVVEKNTHYGQHLRTFLTDQSMSPNDIVIPSELAAMRKAQWGQLDFLMLWFHVMSGVSEDGARRIEDELRTNDTYKDAKWAQKKMLSGTHEENWQVYQKFTRRYGAALEHADYAPMEGVIGVLDSEKSLGGRAERLLAELLEIPYYTLEVQQNALRTEFKDEIDTLTALGAQAIDTFAEEGPRIILRPQKENISQ